MLLRDAAASVGRRASTIAACMQIPPITLFGLDIVRRMGEAGVPVVFLSGGEPMMRPNFWEILAEVNAQGVRPTISTNCTMIRTPCAALCRAPPGTAPNSRSRRPRSVFSQSFEALDIYILKTEYKNRNRTKGKRSNY